MDKRINIDDLVKQRLSGVEENERDGAWMRMSELLDQEPKRKRPAFFFWRNTLGVVSALVLVGLAGMASYKVSSFYSEKHSQSEQLIASAMDGKASAALTIPAIRKVANGNPAAPGNSKTATGLRTESADKKVVGKADDGQYSGRDNMHVAVSNDLQPAAAANEPKTVFLRNTNSTSGNAHEKVAVVNTPAANTPKHSVAATKDGHNKATLVATSIGTAGENSSSNPRVNDNTQSIAAVDQKNAKSESKAVGATVVPAAEAAPAGKLIVASHASASNKISNVTGSQVSKTAKADIRVAKEAKGTEGESVTAKVIADAIAASKHADNIKAEQATTQGAAIKTLSGATAASGSAVVKATTSSASSKNRMTYSQGTTGKKASEHRAKELPFASAATAVKDEHSSSKMVAQESMEKVVAMTPESKVINKLLLRETYIKTAPNDGYFKLDTISMEEMEMLVKQRSVETKENTVVAATPKKKNVVVGGTEETTTAEVAANPNVLAASKEESAGQQGTVVKEKAVAKNTMSTAEKLTLAFNDIKSNIRGTQFAPGVTGGINGTFFGPSGIRGFQFGVTGELIFSDNLSVKGELKYFNRMNSNDFELKDDYYTYTSNGGQYVKTQQMHTLSFATIHSLELPISVRYSSGKFSFFAGGNTVYSFGVNASESTLQAPNPSVVTTKGNDNNPTITEGDFGSRFGLGYLFGMSYQAAPNFIIDLRNVQTVWDNAASSGSKTVSSQLYKHPSFQLSVGYRLGGKKSED